MISIDKIAEYLILHIEKFVFDAYAATVEIEILLVFVEAYELTNQYLLPV